MGGPRSASRPVTWPAAAQPIMELALQAVSLGVAGLHDPPAGGLDLADPSADIGLQPSVGDR
jgi:hypothetical protein